MLALALSLAGNVFGFSYMARQWQVGRQALFERQEQRYSPAVRQAFRRIVQENRPQLRNALREMRAARDDQVRLAGQTPLDETALRAAMDRVRVATDAVQAQLQDYLLEAIRSASQP